MMNLRPGRTCLAMLAFTLVVTLFLAGTPAVTAQDIFGLGGTAEETEAPAGDEAANAPLEALLDVLRDDASREQLIEELEARLSQSEGAAEPEPAGGVNTFGAQIADFTRNLAESAAQSVDALLYQVRQAPQTFAALGNTDLRVIGTLTLNLALLVLITYASFLLIRHLTANLRHTLKLRSERSGQLATALATILLLGSNLVMVVIAWVVGQIVAVTLLGSAGRVAFHHALFLNAFLVVEITLCVVRAILSPWRPEFRLVTVPDKEARMLTLWSRLAVTLFAFIQLLVVPIFDRYVSRLAGEAVSVLGYVVLLGLVVNLTLRLRQPIGAWLEAMTSKRSGSVLHFIARVWHLPVLAYLFVLFVVVVLLPEAALHTMLLATAKIIVAILVGAIVANLLSRLIMSGITLPERLSSRIPLLEQRLNSFVPRALTILRLLVVVVVAAYMLDAIGLFSLGGWLESEFGGQVAGALLTVALILLVAFAAWLAVSSWVDYRLQPDTGRGVSSRERTLLVLMRNAVTVTIIVFGGMFALSEIGINIAPLIASAGVIGLAVGFGAQKLVQDIITGIFIQLEGAIDVGDVVDLGGIIATVERLTIRSAGLRDLDGVYHLVPFSSVAIVSNYMRGFAFSLIELRVAYREDVEKVKTAMMDAFAELLQDSAVAPNIVGREPEWFGLDRFTESAYILRLRIKTLPGEQWGVRRAYNGIVKRIFDERGIEIPFPHQRVYFGNDMEGHAPSARLVRNEGDEPRRGREAPRSRRGARPSADDADGSETSGSAPEGDDR